MNRIRTGAVIWLCWTCWVGCQTFLEDYFTKADGQIDEALIEDLHEFMEKKPDLNTVSPEMLSRFPLFTERNTEIVLREREKRPFSGWRDFRTRTGTSEIMLDCLQSCFSITHFSASAISWRCRVRQRIQRSFPESDGYKTGAYPGSIWKTSTRLHASAEQAETGWLCEKDPGETAWNDHWTGYGSLTFFRKKCQVIAGHYQIRCGLGLVFGGPYGSRSLSIQSLRSVNTRSLRGYLSADENHAFSGTAAKLSPGRLMVIVFYARNQRDAAADSVITSLPETGLHRTATETGCKNRIQETMTGGRIAVTTCMGTLGCTGYQSRLSLPLAAGDPLRQHFAFQGDLNRVAGMDWKYDRAGFCIAGEWAASESGGDALIIHTVYRTVFFDWVFSYRHYSPDFHNPYAAGFSSGDAANEQGWFMGMQIDYREGCTLGMSINLSGTPWRTYFLPMPERTADLYIQADHRIGPGLTISGRLRFRSGPVQATGMPENGPPVPTLQNSRMHQVRLRVTFIPAPGWQTETRLESNRLRCSQLQGDIPIPGRSETGFLMAQKLSVRCSRSLTLKASWVSYNTDNYDTRVYFYENDLPGNMNSCMLYGRGIRRMILLTWKIRKYFKLSVKYAADTRDALEMKGTGPDRILGDTAGTFGLQIEWNK
ncbi:hypothetical protein JW948_05060 [bacterium]|nr:hypothetical protein [bacterium]